MTVKIGINGFGRIGRQVYKAIYENYKGVLDVEAINDLMPVETNAHMLKYDSTYGRFPGKVETKDGPFHVKPGDFVCFKDGLKCTWDIKQAVKKHYNFP